MPAGTSYLAALGRLLIVVIFIVSGVGKIFAPAMTQGYIAAAGLPSPLITRGEGLPPDNAKRRNSFAAIRSRLGDNMNSIVSPAESTARYR